MRRCGRASAGSRSATRCKWFDGFAELAEIVGDGGQPAVGVGVVGLFSDDEREDAVSFAEFAELEQAAAGERGGAEPHWPFGVNLVELFERAGRGAEGEQRFAAEEVGVVRVAGGFEAGGVVADGFGVVGANGVLSAGEAVVGAGDVVAPAGRGEERGGEQ